MESFEPGLGAANGSSYTVVRPPTHNPNQPSPNHSYTYTNTYTGATSTSSSNSTSSSGSSDLSSSNSNDPSSGENDPLPGPSNSDGSRPPDITITDGPITPPSVPSQPSESFSGWWNMTENPGTTYERVVYGHIIPQEGSDSKDMYLYEDEAGFDGDGRNCFTKQRSKYDVSTVAGVQFPNETLTEHVYLFRSEGSKMFLISQNQLYQYYYDAGPIVNGETTPGEYFQVVYTRLTNVSSEDDFPLC